MAISIQNFAGLIPRLSDRLIPDNAATIASNVNLTTGEIRPMRSNDLVNTPSGSGPWLAVYRAVNEGVEKWLAWGFDVDIAKAPLPSDVEPRYYWTGDSEPRYATFSGLPSTFYALGIPTPIAGPTVTPSGGVGSNVSRVYGYTFFSALGEESGISPISDLTTGKVDATWAIAGMDAVPANSGTITGTFSAGKTTFTNTGNHWLREGDEIIINSVEMLVTDVTSNLEFKVSGNYAAFTSWSRVAPWNTTGMKRRLYRSAGTNATLQLVHDDVGTSYNDTLTDLQIMGDELISLTWQPPRTGMKAIGFLPSGSAYGIYKNLLCLSEPYQPHAWPQEYEYAADFNLVGVQSFGTTIVAASEANPYVGDGIEPASMTFDKIDQVWPCLSKRSVVSMGNGVLYATTHGMAFVGSGGPNIWTSALYTVEEWGPLNPASMIAAVAEGRVFLAYTAENASTAMLIFNPGEQAVLTELAVSPTELYADPLDGKLYIVDLSGISGWNASSGEFISFTWKSREFILPFPTNFGAAKVDFSSAANSEDLAQAQANYNADIATNLATIAAGILAGYNDGDDADMDYAGYEINGDNLLEPRTSGLDTLTFVLFSDGVEKYSRTIISRDAFRLPSGFKADNYAIQVSGTVKVKSIKLAETLFGLKQV